MMNQMELASGVPIGMFDADFDGMSSIKKLLVSKGKYPMEYDIKYENGKVVFIAKHKDEILVLLAKYFRSETLGI